MVKPVWSALARLRQIIKEMDAGIVDAGVVHRPKVQKLTFSAGLCDSGPGLGKAKRHPKNKVR